MPRWLRLLALGVLAAAQSPGDGSNQWADCPVQLLDVEQDFSLTDRGLRYLERQRSPLFLVPVLGVYRSGKSFLLNRCMGMQTPYQGGFGVGHGQDTHTRGIQVCAEFVDGLGTVVWMDTEGLFSSEFARSTYGPKMFSLALLFSSTVLLNSVKVLNDQFFGFFSEQQQVARVLRRGLEEEGLPEGSLLPRNLSVVWVLSQPINYAENATEAALTSQLDSFLAATGNEAREHVRKDFQHRLHVVPVAAHDARLWGALHTVPDSGLSPQFVESARTLRQMVLQELHAARPMQAESVAKQLAMYAQLVKTERFSGPLVRQALEEAELSSRCGSFGTTAAARLGRLPSTSFDEVVGELRTEAAGAAAETSERLHFGSRWEERLLTCLDERAGELRRRNDEALLEAWEDEAKRLSESSGCYFLDALIALRDEKLQAHGRPLSPELRDRTVRFAVALQRGRLVECLKVRHLLWPFAPVLLRPVLSLYLRGGPASGLWQLLAHGGAVFFGYALLRTFGQLPPYLDIEYPVLRSRPQLLDVVMKVLPRVPWVSVGTFIGSLGWCWCGLALLRSLSRSWRSPGDQVGGLLVLERKVNGLRDRSEAALKHQLLVAIEDVELRLLKGDEEAAALALLRSLHLVRSLSFQDPPVAFAGDAALGRRIGKALDRQGKPLPRVGTIWKRRGIFASALASDLSDLPESLLQVLDEADAIAKFELRQALGLRRAAAPDRTG